MKTTDPAPGERSQRSQTEWCPRCHGTGECDWCGGTGEDPGPKSRGWPCYFCNATGDCPECGGSGRKK